ncbi:RNA pseudouridine synthase [Pseudomonas sp. F1_0610]|uniref:RNA pseudouridine synthase n=1 Tax=Pseudomonas sp. F1_0610 TaxID=3114284 RepID=UPI0039C484D0
MSTQRLSKRLMQQIQCSRSEAERYILAGFVQVDGQAIDLPQHEVADQQQVTLAPNAKLIDIEPMTLLANQVEADLFLNKDNHWTQDTSNQPILNAHFMRLKKSLPLPANCTGLQVFSQDWRTQRKLNDDAQRLEQEFILTTEQTDFALAVIQKQSVFAHAKISWQNEWHIRLAMKKPPQDIVALLTKLGLKLTDAKRIRIGGISLGKVPDNQWRYMRFNERF